MNVEECVESGLLLKTQPSNDKAIRSLDLAEHKLELAEKELNAEIYENAIVSAYTSMFHAARALLFRDGHKERSHYALCIYTKEKYGDRIEKRYIHELNTLRMQRHDLMYGLEERSEVREAEAESAISIAGGFLKSITRIVEGH
jgi:uncharacterized protein (UPF0332 family)